MCPSLLLLSLTFHNSWEEFTAILPNPGNPMPSNHPWEGVQMFYERLHNLKNKFWKTSHAGFGELQESIIRIEFQLRGAIHAHCMLWVEKSVEEMIAEGYIRADRPDPQKEPILAQLVDLYQTHHCKPHICGGPGAGRDGKCKKGFPAEPSDHTYHRLGDKRYTYQRTENDVWIVPYNAALLLLWEGHCNVQYVTDDGLIAYIVKYVTKTEPSSLLVAPNENTRIDQHILARRLGSMEIMVMALGLDIFRCSSSSIFLPTTIPSMRNSTVRPPHQIEEDPDNPYFPDSLEKYFARPQVYEDLTYFKYFQHCEVRKARIQNRDGPRPGIQDQKGYWIYQRKKLKLIRSSYRRLCDGESFFFVHLLHHCPWRSDEEILGDFGTYRERLFALDPAPFQRLLTGHDERELAGHLAVGTEYLEMVQRIAEALPVNTQNLVSRQLEQLNSMTVPGLMDAAAVTLHGEQYTCYATITRNIQATHYGGRCFFVTGPGGTGKSYLLQALQYWCNTSHNQSIVLAPTGIAARNIQGNTIHSALSIYEEAAAYQTGIFRFNEDKREALKHFSVLIIDEVSMVDAKLLDYVSSVFRRLKGNRLPFGGIHVIVFGDLMQLPPVQGEKVWEAAVWPLFHPIFLREPHRQRDRRFFDVLNKIRFGIVDEQVRELLTECWQRYNPAADMWTSTYLCPLRDEAEALNRLAINGLPDNDDSVVFYAEDYENDERIDNTDRSTVFKKGTNFPSVVICKVGAKVMYLTNSMLSSRGIANGSLGIITDFLANGDIVAAFPTADGIQVR